MRGKGLLPFFLTMLVVVGALVYTFVEDNEPLLGLDLQGGVSVVLQPTGEATTDQLNQAIDIMRRRVDALGVAEPEVTLQGSNIIVSLPGVDDPQRALDLVGQTAELRFRPVLEAESTEDVALGTGEAIDAETTPPDDVTADEEAILEELDDEGEVLARYRVGPTAVRGEAVSDATAQITGINEWYVALELRGGEEGIDAWNAIAEDCFFGAENCPGGRIAIELDGTVISAPAVQPGQTVFSPFEADQIQISGGFTEQEAKDLALVLRFGALPVELETQQTQTVSATLGRDALDAGIVAGIVGILLVALYMVAYYRVLGVIAMASFFVAAGLLWAIVAWLGTNQGLALTLAGVTGLIVAVGVSVDSNIVYYENIKEDVRAGRTVRTAIEKAFSEAFSTIVKADVSTLIGAALIYWVSIGPVRGFALFLGLATVLDLVVAYWFMRPLCIAVARTDWLTSRPGWLGIPMYEERIRTPDRSASATTVGVGS
jgi:preprotein translocase subunit SecD